MDNCSFAPSDLWRAVANQLLSRYANDPATDGLGIYLVLWMEPTRTASLEKGDRPETPADLRERLLDSLKLNLDSFGVISGRGDAEALAAVGVEDSRSLGTLKM